MLHQRRGDADEVPIGGLARRIRRFAALTQSILDALDVALGAARLVAKGGLAQSDAGLHDLLGAAHDARKHPHPIWVEAQAQVL